jgi:hypothetical protein
MYVLPQLWKEEHSTGAMYDDYFTPNNYTTTTTTTTYHHPYGPVDEMCVDVYAALRDWLGLFDTITDYPKRASN